MTNLNLLITPNLKVQVAVYYFVHQSSHSISKAEHEEQWMSLDETKESLTKRVLQVGIQSQAA